MSPETFKNPYEEGNHVGAISSGVTIAAIPAAAPFSLAQLIDNDFMQTLIKIVGH